MVSFISEFYEKRLYFFPRFNAVISVDEAYLMAKMPKKECWTKFLGLSSFTLLFFVAHFGKIVLAMDGCKYSTSWRCGDQCL